MMTPSSQMPPSINCRRLVMFIRYKTRSCTVVNKLSQFMYQLTIRHWSAVKRLLLYFDSAIHYGLFIKNSPLSLHVLFDADWTENIYDQTSIIVYVIFFGANVISWNSKKQKMASHSSIKAKYRGSHLPLQKSLGYNLFHMKLVLLLQYSTLYNATTSVLHMYVLIRSFTQE